MERGNLFVDVKENLQVSENTRGNTNAMRRGGVAHSSEEASVMDVERRGHIIRPTPTVNLGSRGMSR